MTKYCLITLSAMQVEGFVTHNIYGHSTPGTFIGFTTAFALSMANELKKEVPMYADEYKNSLLDLNSGVVSIFHFCKEYQKSSYGKTDLASWKKKNGLLVSKTIMDNPKFNEKVSILFQLDDGIDDDSVFEEKLFEQAFNKSLSKMRFGGGYIKDYSFIIENDLKSLVKKISPGFIMKQSSVKVESIDSLLNEVTIGAEAGWKTATLLGYALVEKPSVKEYSRLGKKHAFAEPLIGLVEFKYLNKNNYQGIFEVGWVVDFMEPTETENGVVFYKTIEVQKKQNKGQ